MTEFDRILDDAFSQLEAGESVDAILGRYPREAAALEPLLEVAALSLHAYTYVEPASRAGIARGRQRFLTEAARRAEKREKRRRARWLPWLWPARRWVVTVAMLLVFFLAAGTTAVLASANSLPGSPLYPVKIATEEVRLTLTREPERRARLHMERAQRRKQELEVLLARQASVRSDLLISSLNEAEAALGELSRVPAELRHPSLETYTAFALAQAEELEQVRDEAPPAQQPLLDSAANRYRELADLAHTSQSNPDTLVPVPTTDSLPGPQATPTGTSTRPPATPTRWATSPVFSRPTATARQHPTDIRQTPLPTRLGHVRTPTIALTPVATRPALATPHDQPIRTATVRPSIRSRTPTALPIATRRLTRTPAPLATLRATPRPSRPTPTPTATRRRRRSTPTATRSRSTPTSTSVTKPSPTPTPAAKPSPTPAATRSKPSPTPTPNVRLSATPITTPPKPSPTPTSRQRPSLTPTPTRQREPTPTRQHDLTPTPSVATALPTTDVPALPTPTPPAVATAVPTAALPVYATPTPAISGR